MTRLRSKPRTPHGQLTRMAMRWPKLEPQNLEKGPMILWCGPLRGFQRDYLVQVQWAWLDEKTPPFVFILGPTIRPRDSEEYVDIPHLNFNSEKPKDSALCLFDPDTGEWDNTNLIADTTVVWASEWLHHYELWHVTGEWHGPNAPGPISVGEMQRVEVNSDA